LRQQFCNAVPVRRLQQGEKAGRIAQLSSCLCRFQLESAVERNYFSNVKTTSLTIRCPAPLHSTLKDRAKAHHRSLSAEALQVLSSALTPVERLSESELRRRIQALPGTTALTLAETREAIRKGRQ
jgi:plasmid stability protein